MKFANNNWSLFKDRSVLDILNDFQFTLIKLKINNQDETNKITTMIEHSLLENFKPICNEEYRDTTDKEQENVDKIVFFTCRKAK